MNKKIIEVRKIDRIKLRQVCINNNFFTWGDNDDYAKFLKYADIENVTLSDLIEIAKQILTFSSFEINEKYEITDILYILNNDCCYTYYDFID